MKHSPLFGPRNLFLLFFLLSSCTSLPTHAQQLDKPLQNIDEDISAFAFGPDGRIYYGVRRSFKTKKYELEHDDIWVQEANGKKKRLLQGEKFNRGDVPFSYSVDAFAVSPSGHNIAVQLFTTTVTDDSGK